MALDIKKQKSKYLFAICDFADKLICIFILIDEFCICQIDLKLENSLTIGKSKCPGL